MRALVLAGKLRCVRDVPVPDLRAGEALVRVTLAGICNTDLELLRGYAQFQGVPGHEFVGVVERAPDAPEWEGRRVVGEINVACGVCPLCSAGLRSHCLDRSALGIRNRDGAFAEYLALPVCNLHSVPDELADEAATFTEPLAAACEILEQVHVRPSQRAIVVGDGKLGLLCAQVLSLTGCDLTVIGHHQRNLDLLRQWGIDAMLEGAGPGGEREPWADVVVEATGCPSGYTAAQRLVRARGTVVLKSTYAGPIDADLTAFVVNEATWVGSRCGPFAPALRLLERGLVDVAPLVEARYPLSEGVAAFDHAARPGALKVLLEP